MSKLDTPTQEWDVLVTLDATVSAWLKVEAGSKEEAGDKASSRPVVLANSEKFALDEDNFDSWSTSATLPDPDEGIVPHGPTSPLGAKKALTSEQINILKEASKAYCPDGVEDFDLLDTTNPEVHMDGLALFLSRELQDSMKGEEGENCRIAAARSLTTAINQLEDVLNAIYRC